MKKKKERTVKNLVEKQLKQLEKVQMRMYAIGTIPVGLNLTDSLMVGHEYEKLCIDTNDLLEKLQKFSRIIK